MNLKRKKAFTLIELLAVIIIIGVIALIVAPIIIGTIDKSRKSTFARSIDGIVDAVRVDYSDDHFNAPREYFYDRNKLTLLTVNDIMRGEDVKITGRIEGYGFVSVYGEGVIHVDHNGNKFRLRALARGFLRI